MRSAQDHPPTHPPGYKSIGRWRRCDVDLLRYVEEHGIEEAGRRSYSEAGGIGR